ncbi:MAG TPA: YceI family protein [Gemmatimonadaceae bacterium]|nr:YceI family protein [Gemmatimonadaceae bacterium]
MKAILLVVAAALAANAPAPVRYTVATAGNEARYRVREQLLHHDMPNDAVGKTTAISGALALQSNGTFDTAASKITIDVTTLKSDQDRRDGYVQQRLLETDRYPTVVFVPTAISGANLPFASSGRQSLDINGLLTVHGVTRATVWHMKAQANGADVTGTGYTKFTFDDVSLQQPHMRFLLSVADTITLEYDFHFVRQ